MANKNKKENENARFEIVLEEKHDMMSASRILRDKETGVLYLYSSWGYGAGLTLLVDKDGKPLIKE
ncbi:MAG: DUF6440 family protein [Oscillospiraceae bacterium]|nr:DUF6440 family protein [Oscillospiraceae bacterium]